MKHRILITALLILVANLNAQESISLKINHLLGTSPFAMKMTSTNDQQQEFDFTRCEYYLSGIEIVHDSGKVSKASNVYALVRANGGSSIFNLGQFTGINTVESISFSVGVDPGVNNGDPTAWPSNHPLSPKSPSMHWGWSAGYRFAAIEGRSGSNMSTIWEIHALGNKNYFRTNIPTGSEVISGGKMITLNADYVEALSSLKPNSGFVSHGEDDEAYLALRNFQNKVFSSTTGAMNTLNSPTIEPKVEINVYPNPSFGNIKIELSEKANRTILVRDLSGRLIREEAMTETSHNISNLSTGIYILSLVENNNIVHSEKLVVQ
jgi:hypothetical protein